MKRGSAPQSGLRGPATLEAPFPRGSLRGTGDTGPCPPGPGLCGQPGGGAAPCTAGCRDHPCCVKRKSGAWRACLAITQTWGLAGAKAAAPCCLPSNISPRPATAAGPAWVLCLGESLDQLEHVDLGSLSCIPCLAEWSPNLTPGH